MDRLRTEAPSLRARRLDEADALDVAAALHDGQCAAAAAVGTAFPAFAAASAAMAGALRDGRRLIYLGAGSSGLMAAADAAELHGTFGAPLDQIRIVMAGGAPQSPVLPGVVEDDEAAGAAEIEPVSPGDVVIAVSASGATPYTCAAARTARAAGAVVIGIACNADAPLLREAAHPILLPTPPELVAGSTRMGAGTAQKIALNMLSTLMAFELGHVHDGMMVNLVADNAKLRDRARSIIASVASCDASTATHALAAANGAVKPAILIAAGAPDAAAAHALLRASQGRLRPALERCAKAAQ